MKRIGTVLVILLVAAGVLSIATGYTRDTTASWRRDAATLGQSTVVALEALITDAAAIEVDVAGIEAAVLQNTRGTAAVEIAKNTWTALSTIGNGSHRMLHVFIVDDTTSETAVVTIWGKDASGVERPMLRGDSLADLKSHTFAVGTDRIGSGDYAAGVAVMVGAHSHIYIQETTAPAAGTYKYYAGGL